MKLQLPLVIELWWQNSQFLVGTTVSCRCPDLNFPSNLPSPHSFRRIDHHQYWLESLQIFFLAKLWYESLWEKYVQLQIPRGNNRKTILLKSFFLYDSLLTYMESEIYKYIYRFIWIIICQNSKLYIYRFVQNSKI